MRAILVVNVRESAGGALQAKSRFRLIKKGRKGLHQDHFRRRLGHADADYQAQACADNIVYPDCWSRPDSGGSPTRAESILWALGR